MLDRLDRLLERARGDLEDSRNLADLDEWRVKYLGRKKAPMENGLRR
jgi:hypothetical protein